MVGEEWVGTTPELSYTSLSRARRASSLAAAPACRSAPHRAPPSPHHAPSRTLDRWSNHRSSRPQPPKPAPPSARPSARSEPPQASPTHHHTRRRTELRAEGGSSASSLLSRQYRVADGLIGQGPSSAAGLSP